MVGSILSLLLLGVSLVWSQEMCSVPCPEAPQCGSHEIQCISQIDDLSCPIAECIPASVRKGRGSLTCPNFCKQNCMPGFVDCPRTHGPDGCLRPPTCARNAAACPQDKFDSQGCPTDTPHHECPPGQTRCPIYDRRGCPMPPICSPAGMEDSCPESMYDSEGCSKPTECDVNNAPPGAQECSRGHDNKGCYLGSFCAPPGGPCPPAEFDSMGCPLSKHVNEPVLTHCPHGAGLCVGPDPITGCLSPPTCKRTGNTDMRHPYK